MRVERATLNPDSSLGRSRESMATSASAALLEEKLGVIKSGSMQGGFMPFKRKGKHWYVVLSERAIEIYDDEKSYCKKKPSRFTIDLAIAFNVHNEHYHPPLGKCVCVMRPDDTLLLKADSEQSNQEWYDAILGTACPARALRLGRFVQPAEFFECAYDVLVVDTPKNPKIAQKKGEEKPPANIVEKAPSVAGNQRLCFYAHTIIVCQKNIEPGKEEVLPPGGIPPFHPSHFFEIQRKFVPNFGYRDNYFILMLGRGSPVGACELWAECESKHVAEHLHHTLNSIIDREAEKKKRMNHGMPQLVPSIPVSSGHRSHRERAHTQPHRPRLQSEILASIEKRNTHSPLAHLARKSSSGTQACMTASFRTPPTVLGEPSTSAGGVPYTGLRHTFTASSEIKSKLVPHASIFPARRQSDTIKEEATLYQPMDVREERKKEWEGIMRGESSNPRLRRAVSPSTTRSSTNETEDSGGTLKAFDETEDSGGTLKMGCESKPHTPSGSIRNLSMIQQSPRQFVPIPQKKADHLSSSEDDADADVISAGTNTSTGGESISAGEDYAHMDLANWNGEGSSLSVPCVAEYKVDTPRSFVSSSSDSCYSSLAERQARGGRGAAPAAELAPCAAATTAAAGGEQQQFRTYSFGPGHPSYHRPGDSQHHDTSQVCSSGEAVGAADASSSSASSAAAAMSIDTGGRRSGGGGEQLIDAESSAAKEEDRKRAFSLGSKNFFANLGRPFRKISTHRTRTSATSASGASLASSSVSSSGPPPSSASSNHIAALGHPGERDDYRNRSGSFGSGRSTPYSRRSGTIDKSRDHLMELDFGAIPSSTSGYHAMARCGSGSVGSAESPSRSRTSSFGCQVKKEEEEHGLTPSQLLLLRTKQLSIDEAINDQSDYVLTDVPSTSCAAQAAAAAAAAGATSPRGGPPSSGMGRHAAVASVHHHYHTVAVVHQTDTTEALPPPPAPSSGAQGAVQDVMGKSHDARSSQYFETIEETTSGRSSRASSIDEDTTRILPPVEKITEEEDDYALMDVTVQQQEPLQQVPAAAATAATPPQQKLLGSEFAATRNTNRSRSASPSSPCPRRIDSSSTLQSQVSLIEREVKEAAGTMQQLQPLLKTSATQLEDALGSANLSASLGIPKRSSVPVLKDEGREQGAAGDSIPLNYAYLQMNASPSDESRVRSKSGIIFQGGSGSSSPVPAAASAAVAAAATATPAASEPAAAPTAEAAASASAQEHVEYSLFSAPP